MGHFGSQQFKDSPTALQDAEGLDDEEGNAFVFSKKSEVNTLTGFRFSKKATLWTVQHGNHQLEIYDTKLPDKKWGSPIRLKNMLRVVPLAPGWVASVENGETTYRKYPLKNEKPDTTQDYIEFTESDVKLPAGWKSAMDRETWNYYYWDNNRRPKVTTWNHPSRPIKDGKNPTENQYFRVKAVNREKKTPTFDSDETDMEPWTSELIKDRQQWLDSFAKAIRSPPEDQIVQDFVDSLVPKPDTGARRLACEVSPLTDFLSILAILLPILFLIYWMFLRRIYYPKRNKPTIRKTFRSNSEFRTAP